MPLTLVPTPIGNLEDITLRALRVLRESDLIACEDTRTSGVLLRRYEIAKPLVSLHLYNEQERTERLLKELAEGKNVAVISDAGTPGISDPGYLLFRRALEEGYAVDVLPGPSALLPALILSGLPPHPFLFYGFPPEKPGARKKLFVSLAHQPYTMVFYVSPHKAERQIVEMMEAWGDRRAALVREISKIHQEALRGPLSEIAARLGQGVKGEMVLVAEGAGLESTADETDAWKKRAEALLEEGHSVKTAVQEIVSRYDVPKNQVKEFLLNFRLLRNCSKITYTFCTKSCQKLSRITPKVK
ncbi:MAG: 16S rRNA (cytidine(1402)-2'-O)-methyltransferase [Synergistaceae bacterium]|jgi:16S rRNA (cytidine1402-2'-O)-methyltransferase|nr:16S rRNA (cytidine(1402)-2'-O)-methyltransferase [Synergistaceae bacterium]